MAVKKSGRKSGKTAKKTASRPALIRQPNGKGALLAGGVPGNAGGTGRPPAEFKEWCRSLLDDAENREQVEKVLGDRDHPAFKEMWKAIADRAHGKPKEHVTIDATEGFADMLKAARLRAKNR